MPPLTTDSLAEKLSPKLQLILRSREDEIVVNAGNLVQRAAIRLAFPVLVNEVPNLLKSAIDLITEEFGKMNITDLMEFLNSRIK